MIGIVTDSSCDLPDKLLRQHRIAMVPLTVHFGDDHYQDRVDLSQEQFWQKMTANQAHPDISAPGMGSFMDAYRQLAEQGATGLVAVCLSSAMSATYQSAVIATEMLDLDIPVRVIDSRAVSMGLGLQVLEGVRVAEAGGSIEAVAEAVLDSATRVNMWAALDTLEFLQPRDPVARMDTWLGRRLAIKPILTFTDGMMVPSRRVWTKRGALRALVRKVDEVAPRLRRLAVIDGGSPLASRFNQALANRSDKLPIEPLQTQLGAVVGSYSGPGLLGVAYLLD